MSFEIGNFIIQIVLCLFINMGEQSHLKKFLAFLKIRVFLKVLNLFLGIKIRFF